MSENNTNEESGSLEDRLEAEGIAANRPSGDFSGGLTEEEDSVTSESPFFIVRADSDSVKKMINMLSYTSQPMLNIHKVLRSSLVLSRLIWGTAALGICLVLYQSLIYGSSTISVMAPMGLLAVLLITSGMVITVAMLDSYVTQGLLSSFFNDKKSRSFSGSILVSLVGLVLWVVGIWVSVKPLSVSLTYGVFIHTEEVADGLAQISADQALAILPFAIYTLGALVGIVYVVQAYLGVKTIAKNSVKTGNFSDVMQSRFVKVTSQD